MRVISLAAACCFSIPAAAVNPDDETIADYGRRSEVVRYAYSKEMASALRVNHPDLTTSRMQACLDDMAAKAGPRLKLKAAVVICANWKQ